MSSYFYYLAITFFLVGMLWPLVYRANEDGRNYIAHGAAAAGSLAVALCAVFVFLEGKTVIPLWSWNSFGSVQANLDYFSAWFLLLTGILGAAAAIYGVGYCREYYGRRLGLLTSGINAFLLSLAAVFTVDHAVAFLVAWETMTLVSFLLVNVEWEESANRRAAYIYLVMTQVGTAFLMAAYFILAVNAGGFEFVRLSSIPLDQTIQVVVFVFAFIGFATKAGLVPVHIWLPEAHPAAPSHISALMSGVMIKSAVYGFSRVVLDFLPPVPLWCGVLVLVVAVITCILAVLYALMENNIKRLLAYSSIENMGIIFLALGTGLIFLSQFQSGLAALAWMAGLFHVFNHGLFKGLLFLGSGAVIQGSHCRDIEKMGGLIKVMPVTAGLFAFGSMAIAALPPSNGFVSEWFVFQSLFALPLAVGGIGSKLGAAFLIASLGLTGALAAACFVKAFGLIFLAKPRSEQVAAAVESPRVMLIPMAVLALLSLGIGIWPSEWMRLLRLAAQQFPFFSQEAVHLTDLNGVGVATLHGTTELSLPAAIGLLIVGVLCAAALVRLGGTCHTTAGETWTCGIFPTARMEYTATGFSKPIRVAFGSLLGFRRSKIVEYSGNLYYGQRIEYDVTIHHFVNERIYQPMNEQLLSWSKRIRRLQNGSLQLYIGYILAVTIIALIWSTR